MHHTSFRRAATALALVAGTAVLTALPTAPAQAAEYNSIFPAGWDNNVRGRLFMRLGYTSLFSKTKSEEARDVTGFVTTQKELKDGIATGVAITDECIAGTRTGADCDRYAGGGWALAEAVLDQAFLDDDVGGIGTPKGIKVKAQKQVGTPTLSVGYWLDEARNWAIEGFVLAAPISVKLYGDAKRADGTPNALDGRDLVTTKLLPPLVIGSYHFGTPKWPVRPFVGIGVTYAVFFGAKTSEFFDAYQGGKTTVSTRNTFGAGPFLGFQSAIDDNWHVNVQVGQIGLRTTSRLVTANTSIKSGDAVLRDLSPNLANAIRIGDNFDPSDTLIAPDIGRGDTGVTTLLTELVARNKGQANLGNFVREQKVRINSTILNISIGRSF